MARRGEVERALEAWRAAEREVSAAPDAAARRIAEDQARGFQLRYLALVDAASDAADARDVLAHGQSSAAPNDSRERG